MRDVGWVSFGKVTSNEVLNGVVLVSTKSRLLVGEASK